ncbi:MAG: hypothetical protein HFG42_15745 [Lachnospiraceae bacterium]|nr:hypothetical protein [Lachnospiraceae bacterium]
MNEPAVRPEEQTINFLFIIRHGKGGVCFPVSFSLPQTKKNTVENAFKGEK